VVKDVVIVGGGTAGWMTATYLRAAFGDRISITLIESPTVSTIGVGEATFSTVRYFFDYLGLDEQDWMPACNATYKLGIKFENWRARGHTFFHPFEHFPVFSGFTLGDWWLEAGPSACFDQDCFIHTTLAGARRSPRYLDGSLFATEELAAHLTDDPTRLRRQRPTLTEEASQYPYAYQFDAALLADFLAKLGTGQGVRRVVDDVVHCQLDERGWIGHLVTREHGELHGDLFVDCTGFRGLLINKALGEPFISFAESLPNDRAVALRVPVDMRSEGIAPYTTATAMDSGWIWTIPLYGRNGVGYVYASDFCSPDEAERTVRGFVGPAADGLEANHIRMRVGRNRRSWVNNCVAIGLSSAFVEPLESTGIFFIQHGVEHLVKHFPTAGWEPALVDQYNRLVANCLDGVHEFLVLHYYGAGRRDTPYWQATKERALPDGLRERLELWSVGLPGVETIYPHYHGFEPYNWAVMLLGLGGIPVKPRPALELLDPSAATCEFETVRRESRRLARELPSHYDYLSQMH
jgi:flavin-dependent dehydrogenase